MLLAGGHFQGNAGSTVEGCMALRGFGEESVPSMEEKGDGEWCSKI